MTKQQMKERKAVVNEQVRLLKMIYAHVEVVDYKSGLIKCREKDSEYFKLYKDNIEVFEEYKIGYIEVSNKNFILLRILVETQEEDEVENPLIKTLTKNNINIDRYYSRKDWNTLLLDRDTMKVILKTRGSMAIRDKLCNGKYAVVAPINYSSSALLLDINNKKIVLESEDHITGLLEQALNKLGKGAFK